MSILPNVFSDPKLRARQDQLDAQWNSLWATWNACNDTPDSAFPEFATDRRLWKDFYDSETDWSASAKTATDEWQVKAASWASKLSGWCGGGSSSGIPTIGAAPPDDVTLVDRVLEAPKQAINLVATLSYVAVGFAVLVVLGIIYISTKGKVSGYGVTVGSK